MSSNEVRRKLALTSPLWHKPGFLKLWAGQSVSLMGSSVTGLALPLTAIYVLHVNAGQIGLLKTLQWMPYIFISLFVGAWSDRRRRRPVMIAVNLGEALVLGLIVTFAKLGVLSLPMLYVAVLITGSLTVFFDVTYTAYLPTLVSKKDLLGANSRLQSSSAVAQISGPALAGLLIQLVTAPLALLADAVSFLVSVASLLWIREREPAPERPATKTGVISQIKAGLVVVVKDSVLRALAITSALFNLFAQWINVLFLIFAVRTLGMSAGVIGAIASGAAVGALIGSLCAGMLSRVFGVGRVYMASVFGECLVLLAVPFVPSHRVAFAAIVMTLAFAVNGAGSAISSIGSNAIRQAVTPQHLIGRMTATNRFISYGVIAIGALVGGFSGEWFGLRAGMLVGAIGIQFTTIWVALSPLPRMRELTLEPAKPKTAEPETAEPETAEPETAEPETADTEPARTGQRLS